jgi:hypothetical protein
MKLEMDLRGTTAPSKSIFGQRQREQQVIPIEQQLEYLNAFAGLYEDEGVEEWDRVKARKRTCRVVIKLSPSVFQEVGRSHADNPIENIMAVAVWAFHRGRVSCAPFRCSSSFSADGLLVGIPPFPAGRVHG